MNYGFAIDNRTCIGCHACSTACKAENEVPLGVYRTWVKYVEKGTFPDVRRTFQVTRCNHCANPPCVRICPVEAMFQRHDGIVDFDPRACIGCKACLQACPYDAIYVDPSSGTAAKCHFCAHRVEVGLEPACVVVCPEQAIVAGDLDDPDSRISRLVAREHVTVRKPEQGTAPKLFYVHGDEVSLTPGGAPARESYMWADGVAPRGHATPGAEGRVQQPEGRPADSSPPTSARPRAESGRADPYPQTPQGLGPSGGPIFIGDGRLAGHMVQTAYDVQHVIPWHWPVPAYLVTKGIAAGVVLTVALLAGMSRLASMSHLAGGRAGLPGGPGAGLTGGAGAGLAGGAGAGLAGGAGAGLAGMSRLASGAAAVPGGADPAAGSGLFALVALAALLFTGLTTVLLVADLERPERFLRVLTRPQWRSWLTRGAWILVAFSVVLGLWFAVEAATAAGWMTGYFAATSRPAFLAANAVLAVAAASYTAFLFGQAEGRDLWQSPLLPGHLVVQAVVAGSGFLLAVAPAVPGTGGVRPALAGIFAVSVAVDLLLTVFGEFGMPHATEAAARAAHAIQHGEYRRHYLASVVGGHWVPLGLVALAAAAPAAAPLALAAAGVLAVAGLYLFEAAFVMAPQEIPNA